MGRDGWLRFDFSSPKLDAFRELLAVKSKRLHEVLYTKVQAITYQLQNKVVAKLSGDVLRVKTGTLRGSVTASTTDAGGVITGTVEAGKGASYPYAMAHTMGRESAYQITASRAKALAFQLSVKQGAERVLARYVTHPPIPATQFVRRALEESKDEIIRELGRAVTDVLKEK
jgi:hypothetical protein